MGSTKWTYHKELAFASDYYIFVCLFENLIWVWERLILFISASVLFEGIFSPWISLKDLLAEKINLIQEIT